MTTDYEPIACVLHDEYELAIMQRKVLSLKWRDDTGERSADVLPVDIRVANGEEFLVVRWTDDGEQFEIRLDKIVSS